jgi:hypothetical protein
MIPAPPPAASHSESPPLAAPKSAHTNPPPGKYPEDLEQIIVQIALIIQRTAEGLAAQEVVPPPFLFIPEDLIGRIDLFQPLFAVRFVLVSIGVIFHGQFAVGLLDLFLRSPSFDSQEPIVIPDSQCCHLL